MLTHGGRREGSGRQKLSSDVKKKSYNVYMNIETFQKIELFGLGESFSSKVVDLVQSEINQRSINKEMKFIDLFAGIGGFRIALEEFGQKCVFSSEIDKNQKNIYVTDLLKQWFLKENHPLIVLTGTGGVGKTTVVRNFLNNKLKEIKQDSNTYVLIFRLCKST